jgi:hypothetical protein
MPTPNQMTSLVQPNSGEKMAEMCAFVREKWQDLVAIGTIGAVWIVTAIVGF